MKIKHKDYLTYEIPQKWTFEEEDDITIIYNDNGNGALILSFYSNMEAKDNIDEQISIMAKKFVESNKIKIDKPFILEENQKDKKILYGTGKLPDGYFFKMWIIAKYPKIIIATYNSEKETEEIKDIDKIISSFKFENL